ncbi:PAS domain-containing protein [Flavobacterium sp. '19STA2R22 D10 B1']|uniref:PAS domain-containing protein n=1 Tax=Flavobacterium aerium TaxID=3037261 RepID=UPI00278BE013|nr:PAS domain-containing protein [Flavobacterium sp. '19STA2R22 D10 B1']
MKDFEQYDEAISKQINDSNVKQLPLESWDFYGNYLQEVNENILDVKQLTTLAEYNSWIMHWDIAKALEKSQTIVVTDLTVSIVFASQNMVKMNGYHRDEVLGKNPKIFQGNDTDAVALKEIKIAIQNRTAFENTIINYCKNGEPYNCHIKAFPIFNKKGIISHFIAFEKTV